MRLVLYQPDIPQNAGAVLRLGACFGVPVEVVEPAGFVWNEARMRRAGMDYAERATLTRHASFPAFRTACPGRLVLLTTAGDVSHLDFAFRAGDMIMLGRESAGVPAQVHAAADVRVVVPMRDGERSLNLVTAAAIVLGEALRQTGGFPPPGDRT